MSIKIALVGNPNSGKTTLYNLLTGSNQYVGNWPGVTVEKKEGRLKHHKDVVITDLPGIYSLSPYTSEELVARRYLLESKPDVIINIIDASNLERNLYLTTQLKELGIPIVMALNMIDLVRKHGDEICLSRLEEVMGCPGVELSALKGEGCRDVAEKAISLVGTHQENGEIFSPKVEALVSKTSQLIAPLVPQAQQRFYAIKLLERDRDTVLPMSAQMTEAAQCLALELETQMDDDGESVFAGGRYDHIGAATFKCYKRRSREHSFSEKVDRVVGNKWLALPIFAAVMFAVYYISISTIGTMGTDWVNDVLFGEIITPAAQGLMVSMGAAPWLESLVTSGIIGGVGAVLGFLPQILVLFFLLALLEDSGYMSRIAVILDKVFRRFGLSGKSFIPILIGTGCSVPGIMASRTIESDSDRKMTVITTSFIPCSAKLPIIAMIAGAMFGNSALVAFSAYLIGIGSILVSGIILKKTPAFAADPAPFVMELPPYHLPKLSNTFRQVWDRGYAFIKKAGTVIFVACGVIWFLSNFNIRLELVDTSSSMLAAIGQFIAPIFTPLGFGTWEPTVATLVGLTAKENVVGTLGVLYGFSEVAENGQELWSAFGRSFTALSAYSFLIFNLLCAPCIAALGAIKREMSGTGLTFFALSYQTIFAYIVAFVVFQLGNAVILSSVTVGSVMSVIILIATAWWIIRPAPVKKGALKWVQ